MHVLDLSASVMIQTFAPASPTGQEGRLERGRLLRPGVGWS